MATTTPTTTTPHVLEALSDASSIPNLVPIRRVLISVYDKTGIVDFAKALVQEHGVTHILSTGGTAALLQQQAELAPVVQDVSAYTGAPECLHGRVKTLHPKVHGGLLAVRDNPIHQQECQELGIAPIDMTIVNLYPFEQAVAQPNATYEQVIENIDIGGPSMLRSTAKNHAYTTIVTSPSQYSDILQELHAHQGGGISLATRKRLAAAAFGLSAAYDAAITNYLSSSQLSQEATSTPLSSSSSSLVTRVYQPQFRLKYGCNPHQTPAYILSRHGSSLPFTILNGVPGYINLLDACNAWQLVQELDVATGLAAAASFKHVSPAGAAVAVPLSDVECAMYGGFTPEQAADLLRLSPGALAYVRARNADPLCSYGDFCALSREVDEATAKFLKTQVSDGIVAPGFTDAALQVLRKKKNGSFIILQANPQYSPGSEEYREVYGMTFQQRRNHIQLTHDHFTKTCTANSTLSPDAIRDLLVASISIKYTQSNSVGFAIHGMMVGVGAGQQSRVDCVKLAGRKVATWYLRQHPKVLALPFLDSVKQQDRVNARVRYIEGDFTTQERTIWLQQFTHEPEPLTDEEKMQFLQDVATGVSMSSDAFFPFRDSIDHASKVGVSYVAQPGGSVQDEQVTQACNEYGMVMALTGVRLFHH